MANQGRVNLLSVTQDSLNAPKIYEQGEKAGLLMTHAQVMKLYPIPEDKDNFAAVLPQINQAIGSRLSGFQTLFPGKSSKDDLAKLASNQKALDIAEKESFRSTFRLKSNYEEFGKNEPFPSVKDVVFSFALRGKERALSGDADGAIRDFLTIKRIAKLIGQESSYGAWREAIAEVGQANNLAKVLADEWKSDPSKMQKLKLAAQQSYFEFDLEKFMKLRQFADMNSAANANGWYQPAGSPKMPYFAGGVAPDARRRVLQVRAIQNNLAYKEAWENSNGDPVKLEKLLLEVKPAYSGESGFAQREELSVGSAVNLISLQRQSQTYIEMRLVEGKLGRWPLLSEIKGDFTIDPRSGTKFKIRYMDEGPELSDFTQAPTHEEIK